MRRLRLLLDANVLVDAQLRDLFFTAAERGLIECRWTEEILAELHRTLIGTMGRDPTLAGRLCSTIRTFFADDEIVGYPPLSARDPGDDHVLGAAVYGECDVLVTHDRNGFPDDAACEQWDLEIFRPDDALILVGNEVGADVLADVFSEATLNLRTPPVSLVGQLRRLETVAPSAAIVIGAELGFDGYRELLAQTQKSMDEAQARQADEGTPEPSAEANFD